MKKIICIYFTLINFVYADYTVSGSGPTKGDAYINAMSKAPSGPHWILNRIYYSPNMKTCTIIWKEKK